MFAAAFSYVTPSFKRPLTNIQRVPRRSSRVLPVGDGTVLIIPPGSTSST
jgi:hypothetical protein